MKKKIWFTVLATLFCFCALCFAACSANEIQTVIDNNKTKLATPTNVYVDENTVLRWDEVSGATSYIVLIGNDEYSRPAHFFDLKPILKANGSYEIYVRAKSEQVYVEDSSLSSVYIFDYNGIVIEKLTAPVITTVENDIVYWSPVENAEYYTIQANKNGVIYTFDTEKGETTCSLADLKRNGENISGYGEMEITVKACADKAAPSDWSDNYLAFYVAPSSDSELQTLANWNIGYGYNLLENEYLKLNNYKSAYAVFDLSKLLTVATADVNSHNNTAEYEAYSFSSVEEFLTQLDIDMSMSNSVGASASYAMCKAAANLKTALSLSMSTSIKAYASSKIIFYNFYITNGIKSVKLKESDERLLKYSLNSAFVKDLCGISASTANMTYEQRAEYILNNYGTHAILGVNTGGILTSTYVAATNKLDVAVKLKESSSIDTSSEAGASFMGATASVNSSMNLSQSIAVNSEYSFEGSYVSCKTTAYGGKTDLSLSADATAALKGWEMTSANDMPISVYQDKAYDIAYLISLYDNDFGKYFAKYISDRATDEFTALTEQFTRENSLPVNLSVENGKNVMRIDLSAYQESDLEGVYNPNLVNGVLTVYPVYCGKNVDKIVVSGAFNEKKTLIDGFSIELSKQWKRDVDIEFENCGIVCAAEQGLVDDSKVTKNINVNLSYKGINYVKDKQGNENLYSEINGKLYNFTFEKEEGITLDTSTVRFSDGEMFLVDAEKENYNFLGWCAWNNGDEVRVTDKLCKVVDTFELNELTISLHADFGPAVYEITLNNQFATVGGTEKIFERYNDRFYAEYDDNTGVCGGETGAIEVPQKTGYDFLGYYESVSENNTINAAGTTLYIDKDGKLALQGDTPAERAKTFKAKITLYALWKPHTSEITLYNWAGDNGQIKIKSVYNTGIYDENDNEITQTEPPVRAQYIFGGYYKAVTDNETANASGTDRVIDNNGNFNFSSTTITSDVTYYALWTKGEFAVTLITNDGTIDGTPLTTYSSLVGAVLPRITKAGYTFEGWYDEEDNKWEEIPVGTDRDLTITAKWSVDVYEIGKYVPAYAKVTDSFGNEYRVCNSIDCTPFLLSDKVVIVDWRNETDLVVSNHIARKDVPNNRYNNVDIASTVNEIIFIGDESKTYSNFRMYFCAQANDKTLKITFKDFNFNTNEKDSLALWDCGDCNVIINIEGSCSFGTLIKGSAIINMYDNGNAKLKFTGNGTLSARAGDGATGGNGGIALYARDVEINMSEGGKLEFYGGNGGNGAAGSDGWQGYIGFANYGGSQTPSCTAGAGGNGGNGGNGGDAIWATYTINIIGGMVYCFGGNGGKGGNGGAGGHGGENDGRTYIEKPSGLDGARGGNGGNGGNGGLRVRSRFVIGDIVGASGIGGDYGFGGYGGTCGASIKFGVFGVYTATGSNGANGTNGEGGITSLNLSDDKLLQGNNLFLNGNFIEGENRYNIYDNTGKGVKIEVVESSAENQLGLPYEMKVTSKIGSDNRHMGGYYGTVLSAANKVFYYTIYAKIPVGYSVDMYANEIGNGAYATWLTDNKGTGEFKWYIGKTVCGSGGTFSTLGFVAIYRNEDNFSADDAVWYVGYSNVLTNPVVTEKVSSVSNGSSWYDFYSSEMSWTAANAYAESLGGHLVVINSAAEENLLIAEMRKQGLKRLLIGLTDTEQEGVFKWVDGTAATYTHFGYGQPDNYDNVEDYVEICVDVEAEVYWNDLPDKNTYSHGFIVEYDNPVVIQPSNPYIYSIG